MPKAVKTKLVKSKRIKAKKPIIKDLRSFKGSPLDAVPYPKNMLKATLDLSEGTTNASLNQFGCHILNLAKEHIGMTPDPANDLMNLLAELKAFVRTDQIRTRRSIEWLDNYHKAYDSLLGKVQSENFKEKSNQEIFNYIVQFIQSVK